MDFSVVIPAYNCEDFLEETIDSILTQSLKPKEVFVVDDGSTDATWKVIQKFGKNVSAQRIENSGPGAARAFAITQCKCSWIALCDSDDLWRLNHLERKAEGARRFKANVVASNFVSFGPSANSSASRLESAGSEWIEKFTTKLTGGFLHVQKPYRSLLAYNPIYPSGLVFSADLYHAAGGIIDKYSRWKAEDSEFIRRLVGDKNAVLLLDEQITWDYRRHSQNFSAVHWRNLRARGDIIQEHLRIGIVHPRDAALAKKARDDAYSAAFDTAFWERQYGECRHLFRNLPEGEATFKRRIRYWLATLYETTVS